MPRNAGKAWSSLDDLELSTYHHNGLSIREIAIKTERTPGAIRSRLKKQGILQTTSKSSTPTQLQQKNTERRKKRTKNRRIKTKITSKEYKQKAKERILNDSRVDESILDAFYYVYFVVNKDSEVYIGFTRDLAHRIYQHNNSLGAKATKDKGPWHPFFVVCALNANEALKIESRSKRNFKSLQMVYGESLAEVLENIGATKSVQNVRLLK